MFEVGKKNWKLRCGFSLAEMMVVMLMVAIVLAATAPMITRKISRERSDKIFDMLNIDPTNAVEYIKGRKQRIYMNGRPNGYVGIREAGDTIPANSVLFGYNKYPDSADGTLNNFVGIGFNTENKANSIAIGYGATTGPNGIAIGANTKNNVWKLKLLGKDRKYSSNSIAIGYNATTKGSGSVAIGYNASAGPSSVAIGANAKSTMHSITLGTKDDTVYIPGNLVVDHATLVGRAGGRYDNFYSKSINQNYGMKGYNIEYFTVITNNQNDFSPTISLDKQTSKIYASVGGYSTGYINPPKAGLWPITFYNSSPKYKIDFEEANRLSDIRKKNVGEIYTGSLAELDKLKFYHFTFKDDKTNTPQIGVIAQDLQKVFPNAVKEGDDGYLRVRWDEMFYAAINAIKELNTKVCALAENVQNIIKDITDLKTVVEKQQTVINAQAKTLNEQQIELSNLSARIEKLEHKK